MFRKTQHYLAIDDKLPSGESLIEPIRWMQKCGLDRQGWTVHGGQHLQCQPRLQSGRLRRVIKLFTPHLRRRFLDILPRQLGLSRADDFRS